ncbi:MAG: glycosyltransferase [Candidatus Zixiibacteriota bacterium]
MSRQRIAELRVGCQNDPASASLHREAVTEFMAAGLPGEALPLLRRLVNLCPDDPAIIRQLADAHSMLGNNGEALDGWRRLRAKSGDSEEILHNLGVAACVAGEYDTARDAFEAKLRLKPDCYETYNDLAVLYSMLARPEDSARAYLRCLEINPRYEKGRENAFGFFLESGRFEEGRQLAERIARTIGADRDIEQWKSRFDQQLAPSRGPVTATTRIDGQPRVRGRRIGFVASSDAFLTPIVEQLSLHNDVRVFRGQSREELAELIRWAELVWLEWCDGLAIEASQMPKGAKLVCRLHSYEAFTDAPNRMNWSNIDHLVLVSDTVGEILRDVHKIPVPMTVIHNGIDPDRFPLVKRSTPGKKIGSVGYINYKKNPSLLLQTFKSIHDWDSGFELHIAGEHQDPRIKVYFDHLLPRLNIPVTFHGWRQDMPAFYREMDYVISTSLFESFHYSIAEGMLSGCLPLIHSWRGAERLYPNECLFDTPMDAIALIDRYQASDLAGLQSKHRDFIASRYNWRDRHEEIDALLDAVLTGRPVKPRSKAASRAVFAPAPASDLDCGLVSVVIPTHNNSAGLKESLDSVLAQSYRHIEIVVCDDGSTDDTDRLLAEYGDRVNVVRQVHRGLPSALNNAIQASQGRFIAPLLPGDRMSPDRIDAQLRLLDGAAAGQVVASLPVGTPAGTSNESFDVVLANLGGNRTASAKSLSCLLFERSALEQTGWFDEIGGQPGGESAIWESMWRRLADTVGIHTDETPRIDLREDASTAKSISLESPIESVHGRWVATVRGGSSPSITPATNPRMATARIVFVAANDPDGQMAMWAEALTRHTGHTTRLLTHSESKGLPSDLVLRYGKSAYPGAKPRNIQETLAEAESVIRDADLVIFAAGLGPGCLRTDMRIEDTDEQPYGTLAWNELARGKEKAAILFGTPSVRNNLTWYRDRIAAKGWPLLTCEPDLHRWLPESRIIPRLLASWEQRYPVGQRAAAPMAVVYSGKREAHEGGVMMREVAARLKETHPDVMFGRYQDMPWRDVIAMKSRAHIGIDRISVGTGSFGIDSLENSALGLINIVHCDPYASALLLDSIGAADCPWEMPSTPDGLLAALRRFASDPEERTERMQETREWFAAHCKESDLARRVASVLESL